MIVRRLFDGRMPFLAPQPKMVDYLKSYLHFPHNLLCCLDGLLRAETIFGFSSGCAADEVRTPEGFFKK